MNLTLREGVECDLATVVATLSKHSSTDTAEAYVVAGSYFFALQRQLLRSATGHELAPRAFLRHLLRLGMPANFRYHGPIHVSGSRTLLQFVARQGFTDCVETLLEHGADPKACNDFGRGPLHLAAFSGVTACVTLLLRGSAPTRPAKGAPFPDGVFDKAGWSALHCAAHEGSPPEMLEALAGGGLSPNVATRCGVTAWHLAFDRDWQSAAIPEKLLALGANLTAVDKSGWNALHMVARGRHRNSAGAAAFLLAQGIPLDGLTSNGRTALEIAHRAQNPEVFALLHSRGATLSARLPATVRRSPFLGGWKRGETLPLFPMAELLTPLPSEG